MDPSVLGELWRTKQPVIISKPDALGQLYTTTYELSPDEQNIISTTIKEEQSAAKLEVTSTTTASPVSPQTDWEYLPNSMGQTRTFTLTPLASNWPNFGGLPHFSTGQSSPGWPSLEFPAGVTPQTSTKTEQDDQGRTVTTTIKTYRTPVYSSWSANPPLAFNWPKFHLGEVPAGITPKVSTKTELDDQGRTVTTTTKTYEGTVPNNWTPGADSGTLPSSWQPRSNTFEDQFPRWLNRPTLTTNGAPSGYPVLPPPPLPTRPTVQQPYGSQTPNTPNTPKTIATINVNDLPTNSNELPTNTRVTSYSGTFNGVAPPRTADLEPPVRDMLHNAGITDQDILNAQTRGEDIVRNRVMPDGRTIKTTVRLNKRPVASPEDLLPTAPPRAVGESLPESRPVGQQNDRSIDEFLSQVNLKPADILAQNGEVVKTIVDKDGRVLSAKFVLSTVKDDEQATGQGQAQQPTK